jgi:phosphoribosylformylglycinamidine (FGAM) synthase PurS component
MKRTIEIGFKIPDNTAYTALVALRRLGVEVARVERSQIRFFDDEADVESMIGRIKANETIFNPNVHQLTLRDTDVPQRGETWIESLAQHDGGAIAWQLFDEAGNPVNATVLDAAIDRLLCNPAIERAVTQRSIAQT